MPSKFDTAWVLPVVMTAFSRRRLEVAEAFRSVFYPESVALIGVSESSKKMGHHVLKSFLSSGFKGKVYPVNPKGGSLLGMKVYASVKAIPDKIDLAVIAVPPEVVIEAIRDCARKGAKGAVVITAGFREAQLEKGEKLHHRLAESAARERIRVIGPNTFGLVNLDADLNASFTPAFSKLRKGPVSLVSQSGGVCHLIMPYALREGIGVNKVIGLGNRVNTDFADILYYLASDEGTRSVALYVEGIDNPKDMMKAIKEVGRVKPIVAYKGGGFRKADEAARSHTGSLAGRYDLYISAFKQFGAIVAHSLVELISCAKALAFQPPPRGRRVAVVSLVAGLGMISADSCERKGLVLAEFTAKTRQKLFRLMPAYTIRTNPVDLGYIANNTDLCGDCLLYTSPSPRD